MYIYGAMSSTEVPQSRRSRMGLNHGEGVCLPKAAASADGVNEDRGYLGLNETQGHTQHSISPCYRENEGRRPVISSLAQKGRKHR